MNAIKIFSLIIALSLFANAHSQTVKQMLSSANQKFDKVKDYEADLSMRFDIPGVKMEQLQGKVFFKQPEKFKIKTKGIYFLPKQNPYFGLEIIKDTTKFNAFSAGTEILAGRKCEVIQVIPLTSSDLLLGKFWVDASQKLILKSQLTTKSNGTIDIENKYGTFAINALPDQIKLIVDVQKFKVPKMVAVDLNEKSKTTTSTAQKGSGTIELNFANYKINKNLSNEVFTAD